MSAALFADPIQLPVLVALTANVAVLATGGVAVEVAAATAI